MSLGPKDQASTFSAMARALIDTASAKILEEADVAAAQDAAKALCATALQHDPDHVDALVLSAEIFAAVGDDAAAAEILKPLAELGRPEALAPYRACLLRLGRYSDFAGTTPKTAAA